MSDDKVTIDCPRCGGHGFRQGWKPWAGRCYRCKGRRTVEINIRAHLAALRYKRAHYVEHKARIVEAERAGDSNAEYLAECLAFIVEDGCRIRWEIETCGVAKEIIDRGYL